MFQGVGFVAAVSGQAPVRAAAGSGPACMSCHSDGASGVALRVAEQQYKKSGHWLGFRTLIPPEHTDVVISGPQPAPPVEYRDMINEATQDATGSHPKSAGCQGCHTEQGFKERLAKGKYNGLTTVTNPLGVGCFTCHQPHTNGNFNLVSTAPVASITKTAGAAGRTFDGGKGNLCAMCHRLTMDQPDDFRVLWAGKGRDEAVTMGINEFGHQPMEADFMLGQGEWPFDSNYDGSGKPLAYQTENPHYLTVKDTCVGCHMKVPGQTNGMAGHTFFLTNYRQDITAGCAECHGADAFKAQGRMGTGGVRFRDAKIDTTEKMVDYDGDGKASQMLVEIEGLRKTLVDYFLTPANFQVPKGGSIPIAPLRKVAHPDPPGTLHPETLTTYNLYSDYRTNAGPSLALTRSQAESFYNLRMFLFDGSFGIHNPKFAAQVLYDSIMNLNVNAHAGLKAGAKRP